MPISGKLVLPLLLLLLLYIYIYNSKSGKTVSKKLNENSEQ